MPINEKLVKVGAAAQKNDTGDENGQPQIILAAKKAGDT